MPLRAVGRSVTDMSTLTHADLQDAALPDWRLLTSALHARFTGDSYADCAAFVAAVTVAAEEAEHHPDLTLTFGAVDVRLRSHDAGGVTARDVDLARTISHLAAGHDLTATPSALAVLELALDTADTAAQGPFWSALLTGGTENWDGRDDVVDPTGQLPLLWLQGTETHEPPRQRFHLDLWVPADVAPARIEAALAAGGSLVDEGQAPAFVVLADPEGNRVCVCTAEERS